MATQNIDILIDKIYQQVKTMILSNELSPGEKIFQEELAKKLGVSRTPLLQVLQRLESEMLVYNIPRRGTFIKKISNKELLDTFECREGLESICARRTAKNATKKQIQSLKALFKPFENDINTINLKEYQKADYEFHKKIIEYSGNVVIPRIEVLGNIMLITYQKGLIRPPIETMPEHLNIIKAIEERDGQKAEKLMYKHIHKSIDLIERLMD